MSLETAVSGGIFEFFNIIALGVAFGFVITLMLPKKIHYALNGMILMAIGITHFLFEFYFIDFDVRKSPVLLFVITFVAATTAKELIHESIKEKGKTMKGITFLMGLVLIFLVLIPEMYHFGAINFSIPDYPFIVNAFLYASAGLVAMIAPFLVKSEI